MSIKVRTMTVALAVTLVSGCSVQGVYVPKAHVQGQPSSAETLTCEQQCRDTAPNEYAACFARCPGVVFLANGVCSEPNQRLCVPARRTDKVMVAVLVSVAVLVVVGLAYGAALSSASYYSD